MKVLITSNSFGKFSQEPKKCLLNAGFEVVENHYGRMLTEAELLSEIADADAIIVSTEQLNKAVIDHAPKLKVVSRYGVGTDNIDKAYCQQKGITVTITQNANTNAVAEYTVALMLAASRKICSADHFAKQQIWTKFTGLDLYGKTVGLVGLGAIGREVAKKISAFGVNILAYDLFYHDDFVKQYGIEKVSLDELLKRSDVVSLHIPATQAHPLLNQREFELMKQDVVLVNTARASLINIDALIHNLQCKKIFSVALDVHENEPAFDRCLTLFDNVILTPHNAAVSREAVDKMSMLAVQNVLNHL